MRQECETEIGGTGPGRSVGEPLDIEMCVVGCSRVRLKVRAWVAVTEMFVPAGQKKPLVEPADRSPAQGLTANVAERDSDDVHCTVVFRTIPVRLVVLGALKQPNDTVADSPRRGNRRVGGNPSVPLDLRTIRLLRGIHPLRAGCASIGCCTYIHRSGWPARGRLMRQVMGGCGGIS